jgi:pyruvate dehydrogenase E2 component (dihydrolipoamide acetyltransferase)
MAQKLLMIALSPTMTEGTIAKWKKNEGEEFAAGDVLCEVETDKASMDYEAPSSASLLKILVPAGGKASVGQMIAVIGKAGEDPSSLMKEAPALSKSPDTPEAETSEAKPKPTPEASNPDTMSRPVMAAPSVTSSGQEKYPLAPASTPPSSPLARKVARELGVELRFVAGYGPEGRVVEKDVRAFSANRQSASRDALWKVSGDDVLPASAAGKAQARPASIDVPVSGKRAIIAKRLSDSFFSAPHYYLRKEIIVENLVKARASVNAKRESPISINSIIVKLAAAALRRHPEMNVFWRGDKIEQRERIDIGLAVALPDGLITPIVRDCAEKGIAQIDREYAALIEKAKGRGLSPDEYDGAGFTVTNLGSFGIDEFTAIINPPGSAILAVGAMRKKPVVGSDDAISVARTMVLTLGCDHRTIDGAVGARFLADLSAMLEDPFQALL